MAAKDIEAGRASIIVAIRDRFTQGLKLAERRLSQFGRYATATGLALTTIGVGGLAWPIKLSADMEQAKVSFEVFLGSADKAKAMLGDIELLAAKTPFQFDELRDAAKLLLNFGATEKHVLPYLRMLGDISGGDAERLGRLSLAFGQTMAKGRLMGQEVNQMTEQGFQPLDAISKATGISVTELMKRMEDGKVSFAMLVGGMVHATSASGRFYQSMEKQSATLVGVFSTLMDFTKMIVREFGDALAPTLKVLVRLISAAAQTVLVWVKSHKRLLIIVTHVLAVLGILGGLLLSVGVSASVLSLVIGGLATAFAFLSGAWPILLAIGSLLAIGAAAAYRYYDAIKSLANVLGVAFAPVIQTFRDMYDIFKRSFDGIVAALYSGNLSLAGKIAVLALSNAFLIGARWLPETMRESVKDIYNAIVGGNLGIAAMLAVAEIARAFGIGPVEIYTSWQSFCLDLKIALFSTFNDIIDFTATTMQTMIKLINVAIRGINQGFNSVIDIAATMADGIVAAVNAAIRATNRLDKVLEIKFTNEAMDKMQEGFFQGIDNNENGTAEEKAAAKQRVAAQIAAERQRRLEEIYNEGTLAAPGDLMRRAKIGDTSQGTINGSAAIDQLRKNKIDLPGAAVDGAVESAKKVAALSAQYDAMIAALKDKARKDAGPAGAASFDQLQANLALQLQDAIKQAIGDVPKLPDINQALTPNAMATGKTAGSFSATAAALFGNGGQDAQQTTADNTTQMVKMMKQQLQQQQKRGQKGPAFGNG